MSVCLFAPKDLANRWTNMILLYRVYVFAVHPPLLQQQQQSQEPSHTISHPSAEIINIISMSSPSLDIYINRGVNDVSTEMLL